MIKNICIDGHDFVLSSACDIITNSSSVVYIWPADNSVEEAKKIVKEIMESMNVKGDLEDYFDIYIQIDRDYFEDYVLDNFYEDSIDEKYDDKWGKFTKNIAITDNHDTNMKLITDYALSLRNKDAVSYIKKIADYYSDGYDFYNMMKLYIINKNNNKNLSDRFLSLFNIESIWR